MSSDAELLRRSRAGHKEAFAGLVERYQNLVCAVTFGATGDRELAADLAQDTFVAAWTSLPKLRDETRFRAWLCGIARNLVGKTKRRQRPAVVSSDLASDVPDPSPTATETLEQTRSEVLLREVLEGMDESFREPLLLYYWEGHSTKEVAAQLGLSLSAVEQRLSRGRRRIKAEVEEKVDRALQGAKPDKRFAPMVLAAIDVLPVAPPAGPEPSAPARGLGTTAAAVTGLVALALGVWGLGGLGTADEPLPADAANIVVESASPVGQRMPSSDREAPQPTSRGAQRSGALDREPLRSTAETDEIAESIQMELFPNRVVVNLRGGPSVMTEEQREHLRGGGAMPFTAEGPISDLPLRRVRGTVTDAQGRPVVGAAVVAGDRITRSTFRGVEHELISEAGTTTDTRGSFSFDAPTNELVISAAAGGDGFAKPTTIAAGDSAVEVDLVMAGAGSIEGQLTLEGAPVEGYVVLHSGSDSEDPGVVSEHRTDEGGFFRAALLPPGRYRIFAQSGAAGVDADAGEQGPNTWVGVDLRADRIVQQDITFERGVTLECRATRPGKLTYYAFVGVEFSEWDMARDALSNPDLLGGLVSSTLDDEEAFGVIEGLPQESLTVCAVRPRPLFETTTYAECKLLPKPDAPDTTVVITFDPSDPS